MRITGSSSRGRRTWTAGATCLVVLGALAAGTTSAGAAPAARRPTTSGPGAAADAAARTARAEQLRGAAGGFARARSGSAAAPGRKPGAAPTATGPAMDSFVPVTPTRILDTRSGLGAAKARVGASRSVTFQVAGRAGVPASSVTAVALNLTAVRPTAGTFLTAYPTASALPATNSVWAPAGVTTANSAIVALGTGGRVTVFNRLGAVDVLADVSGYFVTGGQFRRVTPQRIVDTRNGVGVRKGVVTGGTSVTSVLTGRAGIPGSGVAAVVGTLTVATPTAGTYAVVYPAGTPRPGVSTVNAPAGRTVANAVIMKLGTNGAVTLFSSAGQAHLLLDVAGYLASDGTYVPIAPTRAVDTRTEEFDGLPLPRAVQQSFRVTGITDAADVVLVPPMNVSAVVVNLTAVRPTANTYLGAGPSSLPVRTSTVNTTAGITAANLAIVKVGAGGMIDVYNSRGSTHVIIDVVGYFTSVRTPTVALGGTVTVSLDRSGELSRPRAEMVGVSEDGRYVAFNGEDPRLVPYGELNGGTRSTFVRDVALGWTADLWGVAGMASRGTGMSSDGGVVSFEPCLPDGPVTAVAWPFTGALGGTDVDEGAPCGRHSSVSPNGRWLVYAETGTLHRRDLTNPGAVTDIDVPCAEEDCTSLAISDDGRYVAYNAGVAVYRYDVTAQVRAVVVSEEGYAIIHPEPLAPSMSADGRYVVFATEADLLPRDEVINSDVFLKDMTTGTTTLVSASTGGAAAGGSRGARISADGSTVVFESSESLDHLTPSRIEFQVYAWDRASGRTTRVSPAWVGVEEFRRSFSPVVSASGAWVAYATEQGPLLRETDGPWVVLTRVK